MLKRVKLDISTSSIKTLNFPNDTNRKWTLFILKEVYDSGEMEEINKQDL